MRLYNSFGYSCVLAELSPSLLARVGATLPRRVMVEFNGRGIVEVPSWP
jgi:hypothetical protein